MPRGYCAAQVVGVAMDDEGIIPEALSAAYRTHGGQVLLTAAEVHSPTTIKTTLARKQALATLAERLDMTIIEDDCHTPLRLKCQLPAYCQRQCLLHFVADKDRQWCVALWLMRWATGNKTRSAASGTKLVLWGCAADFGCMRRSLSSGAAQSNP